jgi:hypothetical protein
MAISTAAMKFAVVAGPAIGGFVYVGGPAIAYGTCTIIFALAMACALAIHKVHVKKAKEPVSLATVFAGFAFLGKQPVVLGAISLDLFAWSWAASPHSCHLRQGHPANGPVGTGIAPRRARDRRARHGRASRAHAARPPRGPAALRLASRSTAPRSSSSRSRPISSWRWSRSR